MHCSPNIIRVIKSSRMRWVGHVASMREKRDMYRILVREHEEKKPLGRPRRKWEGKSKMDLQEVGCGCMDWREMDQVKDR